MKRFGGLVACVVLGMMTWSAWCWAGVSSPPVTVSVRPGLQLMIPLVLNSDQIVAGINGELTYDPAKFLNPVLLATAETAAFNVLGNSPQPGKFRFVVYADPTAALNLSAPIFYIQLQAANIVPLSPTETLTYTISAASSPTGISLDGVAFQPITVQMDQAAVRNWAIYQ